MRAARDCAQQLLLPASAGRCGGTRGFKAARPNFHQSSSLWQPPASGGAVARGNFDRPPTRPAADRGMMCSLSGGLASMGAAVPYAIAAKFAHPERPVVALVGDGAMQMNNMAELITVAKYWRQWKTPRWICGVFNNEDLNQVTWEQRVMQGDPKFNASQRIPNVPYHKFAELLGLKGIFVDKPDRVAP